MSDTTDELREAIQSLHGGVATFAQSVPEKLDGKTVGQGVVRVFEFADNPHTNRGYAWSYELENGKRRIFSVLYTDINSPVAAVRAATVAEWWSK